jgi:carbonic anhydrase/acetyltransferase-like protein (isoleucine patch superfamily)
MYKGIIMANIRVYQGISPQIDSDCYIDESAVIIGRVTVKAKSSIWCNVVLRGDVSTISVGKNSNIQDLTMVHVTHYNPQKTPEYAVTIGDNVTIGHNCCIHACTIKDNVLVGMGSTLLDNCVIEPNVMIGAGSLVSPNKVLQSGYLYFGNPLKQVRPLTPDEITHIQYSADHYYKLMCSYK